MNSKVTRRSLISVIAAGSVAGVVLAVPDIGVADSNTMAATTWLNVRQAPNTSSRILGVLSPGEQVQRRGEPQGEWTPVTYRGQNAWVFSAFVRFAGTDSAAGGTATATDYVHVRKAATTLAPSLGVLAIGETVSVTGQVSGSWAPVNWKGRSGFVYAAYLRFNASGGSAPAPEPPPAQGGGGTVYTTDYVNVRSGPGTQYRVLTVLATGTAVETRGGSSNGWTPVKYGNHDAWMSSDYLSESAPGASKPKTTDAYTTTDVNLRTGPGLNYRVVRVLGINTKIALTGVTQGDWSQVNDNGSIYWISSLFIASAPVKPGQGSNQGPERPANAQDGGTLNTGGSRGLDELRQTTKQVVYAVRNNFPEITTIYGVRPDPIPDHPSGRAVDLMMPNGANDVALGDRIASFLQANAGSLNIEYLIWRQRIWITGGSWEWMADRGGITANHYDHIHVTVNY